jgi:hypothetical protein
LLELGQIAEQFLFFTRTANGKRAGKDFLARLQERTLDRPSNPSAARQARSIVSCTASSASKPEPSMR